MYVFPGCSEDKASACHVGDPGLIPGLGRSPGEGNGNPLQYSCLENPMDKEAWRATVHRVTKSQTQLSKFTLLHFTSLTTWVLMPVPLLSHVPLLLCSQHSPTLVSPGSYLMVNDSCPFICPSSLLD